MNGRTAWQRLASAASDGRLVSGAQLHAERAQLHAEHFLYLKSPWPLYRLRHARILSDPYDPGVGDFLTGMLAGDKPVYVGRIGGCEYDATSAYFRDPKGFARAHVYQPHLERVQELAGYFDVEHDYDNFARFLQQQARCYRNADCLLYCNLPVLKKFRANSFERSDMLLLNDVCRGKTMIDYEFIEAVRPFLRSFKSWGKGKRILIVSPFAESLKSQYERLDQLLVDYEFPDFDLVTYPSSVTWSKMDDTKQTLGVATSNWHEECQRMIDEIASLDFDLAFLSCGSYAASIGDFIRHTMGRSAIYLGGILNVIFNIYGPRYDTPFFNAIMRSDTQIEALENKQIAHLRGGQILASEGMRAYFGERASGGRLSKTV